MATQRWPVFGLVVGLGVLSGLLGSSGEATAGGIAPDLAFRIQANPRSRGTVRVTVQYRAPGVNSFLLARSCGGRVLSTEPLINGATLLVPAAAVPMLSRNPCVAWVSPDRPVQAQDDSDNCGNQAIGAVGVWNKLGLRGRGMRVAVLDTGVYCQSSGKKRAQRWGRIVAWKDMVNGRTTPYDDNGHGSHVAGIVLGDVSGEHRQGQPELAIGAAPQAELVAVKGWTRTAPAWSARWSGRCGGVSRTATL
jgi:subtilisin family serine protease